MRLVVAKLVWLFACLSNKKIYLAGCRGSPTKSGLQRCCQAPCFLFPLIYLAPDAQELSDGDSLIMLRFSSFLDRHPRHRFSWETLIHNNSNRLFSLLVK
jgi:hypothetical protein